MYDFFEGKLAEAAAPRVVVDVGGIGYILQVSAATGSRLPKVGDRVRLHAQLVVTDGEPRLYGFATTAERELFRLLTSVSGVGPQTAMAILSALSASELVAALTSGSEETLKQVKGVGAKTAARLVVELREAAERLDIGEAANPAVRDAIAALLALGFTRLEAGRLVEGVRRSKPGSGSEELVKRALAASRDG
jgi:Holliday junction DNA helicase RuvA